MNTPKHGDKLIYEPTQSEVFFVGISNINNDWIVESTCTGSIWCVSAESLVRTPKTIEFWVNIYDGERLGGSTYNSEAAAAHGAYLRNPTTPVTQHKVTITT
jgi:hypothetical protein